MRVMTLVLATMALVACSNTDSGPGTIPGSGGSGSGGGSGGAMPPAGSGGAASGGTGGTVGGSGGQTVVDDAGTDAAASDGPAVDKPAPRPDAGIAGSGPSSSRQVARPIGSLYPDNGFYEYVPPGYGDGTKRPLLVFFHGVGENGDGSMGQLPRVRAHGPPKLIGNNSWTNSRPFVVLSVQHPGSGCPSADEVHNFMTFAISNYDVDPAKIFLTGLSCGGRGGWAYLGKYQGEQVLAAALIAADSTAAWTGAGCALLNKVAIWGFHGTADSPATDTAGMTNFMACPQPRKDAKYDLLQGATHQQSWERVYDSPAMLDMVLNWMLAQVR